MTRNEKNLPTTKAEWLEFVHRYCTSALRVAKSVTPREWLAKKGLSSDLTGACFNSGQIHHRREQSFKDALEGIGFMQRSNAAVRHKDLIAYRAFGVHAMMFPLRNAQGEIVNFYAIHVKNNRSEYMNDEQGLYPEYPHELTKKLYVVNSILDAATLLQSRVLDKREALIALQDGKVMPAHKEAILHLKHLEEVVYIDTLILNAKKK